MPQTADVDLVILGAGLAGLSLALALTQQKSSLRVQLIEPRMQYEDDRTWSFWAPDDHPLATVVSKRWTRWAYGHLGQSTQIAQHHTTPYQTIESARFYQWATEEIARNAHIELSLGESASGLTRHQHLWQVTTDKRIITADLVMDTRPPTHQHFEKSQMFQCFVGETLSLPGAFDADVAELMTDMHTDEHGFVFTYVLPFSQDHALVEATRFTNHPVDTAILEADLLAIKQRRGWMQASVSRTEHAILPMGLPIRLPKAPNLARAGLGAGGLRAASGYGFLRIQNWARQCAHHLIEHRSVLSHPPEPRIQAWMDALFLDVLRREPHHAADIFFKLYHRVSMDVLIRFMSDQSTLMDKLKVISSLPSGPFLRAIMKR